MKTMNYKDIILEPLNENQKKAVLKTEGPLIILAGAGSGKTKTIIHRLAYLIHEKQVKPWNIAAVTFTNKAANEMKERAIQIAGPIASESQIRTYHSFGLYILRNNASYLNYPSSFTIWDDTDQKAVIQSILKKHFSQQFNATEVRYFLQTISSLKNELTSPEMFAEEIAETEYEFSDILPEVYQMYEIQKTNSLAFDFADLIYQTVYILQTQPEVLEKLQNKFQYFLVDEYQDTNHAQYSMISLLADKHKNLCVIGDDDQAIYGWRGADVNNIIDFKNDYKDVEIIKLEKNYRSTKQILTVSNNIIKNNSSRMEKTLYSDVEDTKLPVLVKLDNDKEEANYIARKIKSLKSEILLSDIALLYRTNAQSRVLEEALLNENIPYRIFGGLSFFARKEIKTVLSYLRFIVNPFDEISFLRIIQFPSKGIGEKSIEKILNYRNTKIGDNDSELYDFYFLLKEINNIQLSKKAEHSLVKTLSWLEELSKKIKNQIDFGILLEDLLDKSGLKKSIEEEDRLLGTAKMENVEELKNSMMKYQLDNPDILLNDFLQDISLLTSSKDTSSEENQDQVNLMTVHNAKGLEFHTVFIVGMNEDVFPHYFAKEEDSIEEERRLVYVAITRAKKNLFITYTKQRFQQGWMKPFYPSIFIAEILENTIEKINLTDNSFNNRNYSNKSKKPVSTFFNSKYKSNSIKEKSDFTNTISSGSSNAKFSTGDRVSHASFGKGRVLRIEGKGDASKIHIFFDDKKSRKFLIKFAKIDKI